MRRWHPRRGASRLLTGSCASSARSASGSIRTLVRSLLNVSIPADPPDVQCETMVFRTGAPNKADRADWRRWVLQLILRA
jgi:hypothetical protein